MGTICFEVMKLIIPCLEGCKYNYDGECKKDNCVQEDGCLVSCTGNCPLLVFSSPQASEDRKRFVSDKARSVLSVF